MTVLILSCLGLRSGTNSRRTIRYVAMPKYPVPVSIDPNIYQKIKSII